MSTVAEQLRQAREAQKLTLAQVAEITKIRSDHLQALEESHFEIFPAAVYVRGSVRTYSSLLKLDVPQVMAGLEKELSGSKDFSESIPAPRSRGVADLLMLQLSKMDWRKAVIVAGVAFTSMVIGGSYLFWRHHRSVDPLKNLKPGLYQSTQSLSGQTLPLSQPRR
jgi:cytoskeletal protein RodZ